MEASPRVHLRDFPRISTPAIPLRRTNVPPASLDAHCSRRFSPELLATNTRPNQTQASAPSRSKFRAGLWTNLHHFAYGLRHARSGVPNSHRSAVTNASAEGAEADALSGSGKTAWHGLIRLYQGSWSRRDPIRDRDLSALALDLARTPDASVPGPAVDPGLAEALRAAAPFYRACGGPDTPRRTAPGIADLTQRLGEYGRSIAALVTKTYQVTWPAAGFPVEVSAYAN